MSLTPVGSVVFNRDMSLALEDQQRARDNIGVDSAILVYLQSLPSTLPSQPNMPYWDNNVLKRSATSLFVIQSGIWTDSGMWIDSETWSDN